MKKFKIFFGSVVMAPKVYADETLNKWLEENPNIEILDFKYQQARYGDHSVCILYEEKEDEN